MNTTDQHIAYVVKRYPRYSETFIVNEILALEATGQRLSIFALRGPEDTHFQDIISRVRAPVTYLPDRLQKTQDYWSLLQKASQVLADFWQRLADFPAADYREVGHAAALAMQIKDKGISHLHAHFASSATDTAQMAAHFAGIRYSFTAHAKDIFHESVDPVLLERKFADAAFSVTVSDFKLRWLKAAYPSATHSLHRIYNGLDLHRFPYTETGRKPNEILAIGRLVEKKGFDTLIEACALLASRGVEFQCRLIGEGDASAQLRALIDRYKLQDRVSLCGPLPQSAVIDALTKATVFAAPCKVADDGNRDGLPTVLIEAMALGSVCVSTRVTGIPELVRHEHTGLCISPSDPVELAASLETLLSNSEKRLTLARAARALVESNFDVSQNAAQVLRLIRNIASPAATETRTADWREVAS